MNRVSKHIERTFDVVNKTTTIVCTLRYEYANEDEMREHLKNAMKHRFYIVKQKYSESDGKWTSEICRRRKSRDLISPDEAYSNDYYRVYLNILGYRDNYEVDRIYKSRGTGCYFYIDSYGYVYIMRIRRTNGEGKFIVSDYKLVGDETNLQRVSDLGQFNSKEEAMEFVKRNAYMISDKKKDGYVHWFETIQNMELS